MRTYWLRSFFIGRELKYLWGSLWQSHAPLYKEDDKKKKRSNADSILRKTSCWNQVFHKV